MARDEAIGVLMGSAYKSTMVTGKPFNTSADDIGEVFRLFESGFKQSSAVIVAIRRDVVSIQAPWIQEPSIQAIPTTIPSFFFLLVLAVIS
jgi:hypothetical protein